MTQNKRLLIDDFRDPDNYLADTVARTFDEGIEQLKKGGWDVLYLDHDLGELDRHGNVCIYKTGYGIMCWLEFHQEYLPVSIVLVTSNPVGRRNMQVVIDKLYGSKE